MNIVYDLYTIKILKSGEIWEDVSHPIATRIFQNTILKYSINLQIFSNDF